MTDTSSVATELLTVPEFAALNKIKNSTVYSWVHKKRIPYVKLNGRLVRIRRADAEAFIKAQLVESEN
jgi:excisionase family DNA binding protein